MPSERALQVAREIGKRWWRSLPTPEGFVADMAAAIDAAGPEWHDINTAPKDGRTVIVYRPVANDSIPHVGIDYWRKIDGRPCWARSNQYTQPTMWQAMPSPPQEQPK